MIKKDFLVSLLMLVLMANIFRLPPTVSAAPGVEITKTTGTVEVQKKGTTEWVKVETPPPYSIYEGDKVRAGKHSQAEIESDGVFPTKLKVYANSSFELQKNPKTGKWIALVLVGSVVICCFGALGTFWNPPIAGILLVTCIVLSAVSIVYAIADLLCASAFKETVNVQTLYENGSLIAQTNITGSLGLYPNGTAWANGQQVSVVFSDGTISEPIEVSLSPSEAMELYKFVYGEGVVGGIVIPVDKFGLLAPYFGLASTAMIGAIAAAVYVKHIKRRKEQQ
jgi:hypothetical protein